MLTLAWIILFLPLLSALGIALVTHRDQQLSAKLSIGAIATGFVLTAILFVNHLATGSNTLEGSITWLQSGSLNVGFGVTLDSLSLLMLLVVTGVGSLIHWY